jgi:hypothetical protein
MVYAENSLHYWRNLVCAIGLRQNLLASMSMGEIMSQNVEITEHGSRPLVKAYTAARLRRMFRDFRDVRIYKRQMLSDELPELLKWMPIEVAGRVMGWNLIVKALKPG